MRNSIWPGRSCLDELDSTMGDASWARFTRFLASSIRTKLKDGFHAMRKKPTNTEAVEITPCGRTIERRICRPKGPRQRAPPRTPKTRNQRSPCRSSSTQSLHVPLCHLESPQSLRTCQTSCCCLSTCVPCVALFAIDVLVVSCVRRCVCRGTTAMGTFPIVADAWKSQAAPNLIGSSVVAVAGGWRRGLASLTSVSFLV
jgi:hypothetical protein